MNQVVILCVLVTAAVAAPDKTLEFRDVEEEIDGNTYVFSNGTHTWDYSLLHCRDLGKRLLTLDTRVKADFWYDWLRTHEEYNVLTWTSGISYQYFNTFYWYTTYKGFIEEETRWAAGEPDGVYFLERCVSFSGSLDGWRDDECDAYTRAYICEDIPQ